MIIENIQAFQEALEETDRKRRALKAHLRDSLQTQAKISESENIDDATKASILAGLQPAAFASADAMLSEYENAIASARTIFDATEAVE